MDTKQPAPRNGKSKGIPLWIGSVALTVLLVLVVGALAAFLHHTRSEKARLERELQAVKNQETQTNIEKRQGELADTLNLARIRQDELLAHVRNATNLLGNLLVEVDAVNGSAADLQTSQAGRLVGLHPELVRMATKLYEVDLPALCSRSEVITRLESVRRTEQQVVQNLGTAYQPDAAMTVEAQNAALWAEQENRKVSAVESLIAGLVSESRVKVPAEPLSADTPTLGTAVDLQKQSEVTDRQREIAEAKKNALDTAATLVGGKQAEFIEQQGRNQAAIVAQETEESRNRTEREIAVREAQEEKKDAETDADVIGIGTDAEMTRLKAEANTPEVLSQLTTFTTPGLWQPGGVGREYGIEMIPMSLSKIRATGALEPTERGLLALGEIVSTRYDHERPRHPIKKGWIRKPDQLAQMKDVQRLLNTYGEALVELGKLSP